MEIMKKKMETAIKGLGFPQIRGPFRGPHNKEYSIVGLHWGPLFMEWLNNTFFCSASCKGGLPRMESHC